MNSFTDYSFLFSSNSSATGKSPFMDYSWTTDLYNIKSGVYKKLLSSYYDKTGKDSDTVGKTPVSKESKNLSKVQGNAESLVSSAAALTDSDSLFAKKETTDSEGNTTSGYDYDSIYKAVSRFVSDYNDLMKASLDSENSGIKNRAEHMMGQSVKYASMLGRAGVGIEADGKLKVDEKALRTADISSLKTVFSGKNSFAGSISAKASMLNISAKTALGQSGTYTNSGNYSKVNSGTLVDSIT